MDLFGQKKAIRVLQEEIWKLSKHLEQLESSAKIQKLEGAEVYDKTMRLMQRMAKRYEVDKKEFEEELPPNSEDSPSVGSDPISRSIMLRRARTFTAP